MDQISSSGFDKPTSIGNKYWPIALAVQKDIRVSLTDSGQTFAYIIRSIPPIMKMDTVMGTDVTRIGDGRYENRGYTYNRHQDGTQSGDRAYNDGGNLF